MPGYRYENLNDPSKFGLILIFDLHHFLSGIQIAIPKVLVEDNEVYDYENSPYHFESTYGNEPAYVVSMYLDDREDVCREKLASELLCDPALRQKALLLTKTSEIPIFKREKSALVRFSHSVSSCILCTDRCNFVHSKLVLKSWQSTFIVSYSSKIDETKLELPISIPIVPAYLIDFRSSTQIMKSSVFIHSLFRKTDGSCKGGRVLLGISCHLMITTQKRTPRTCLPMLQHTARYVGAARQ